MKLRHAASLAALTLVLVGCNRDNSTDRTTFSDRTDRFKDDMRTAFRPAEHSSLDDAWNDTYQPSVDGGTGTTYRSTTTREYNRDNYSNDSYRRDTTREYRTTDTPTPRP